LSRSPEPMNCRFPAWVGRTTLFISWQGSSNEQTLTCIPQKQERYNLAVLSTLIIIDILSATKARQMGLAAPCKSRIPLKHWFFWSLRHLF
jgi:hypothetical protein